MPLSGSWALRYATYRAVLTLRLATDDPDFVLVTFFPVLGDLVRSGRGSVALVLAAPVISGQAMRL